MIDKEARNALEGTRLRLDVHWRQIETIIKKQDQFFERLSRIETGNEYGNMVHIPSVDHSIYLNHLSIKEALQHLINCLNITYSPDKFNQGDDK